MGFVSVCFNVYWLHLPLNFICGKDLCNRVHKQNISVCVTGVGETHHRKT